MDWGDLPADLRRRIQEATDDPRPEAPSTQEQDTALSWVRSTGIPFQTALELTQALGSQKAEDLLAQLIQSIASPPPSRWARLKALLFSRPATYFQKNGQ